MPLPRHISDQKQFTTRAGHLLSFTPLGFGSAPLGNYLRAMTEDECDAILARAWDSGIRYFDTAPFYGLGLSEVRIGRLLRDKPRSSFTISTKVGRLLEPCAPEEVNSLFFKDTPQVKFIYDYSYDGVMRSHEASLKRMGLDRFDILFVHDVDALSHGSREASEERIQQLITQGGWKALTELRAAGTIGAIGAGVNEWQPCARLLELVDPDLFLLAGRYTLLEQDPLETLFPECARRNVGIVIGGPFNSGILAGKDTFNYSAAPPDVVTKVRQMQEVCSTHHVSLPRAALQLVLAHPLVVSVIPGGQTVAETDQNVAALHERIPTAFWRELKSRGLLHPDAPTP
jgi:D-threo-aldose 1-dehydrogenase